MWHEARRQERKIKGMLVDYRKRAERRRDFYEKIKADPTQFLQVHGRQCKIHLDPAIAAAADSAVMMPWQGNENNLIDRFDVRAHLDHIPPVRKDDDYEFTQEERQLNYERYRIIAQNAYLSISEEKFLKQLHLEEQFGYTESKGKKDSKGMGGVAIGFNYEEGTAISAPPHPDSPEDAYDEDNSDSDLDVDLAINVSKIDSAQAHEMNKHGQHFGMSGNDFYSFLTNDLEEAESFKLAKEEEHEKALYSGRKSRRERRAHREKRLANRKISPPSYAAKESPTNTAFRDESRSPSKSPSPDAGKITYITSFGDDEEVASSSKPTYADKVKFGKPKSKNLNNFDRFNKKSRSRSRDVSFDSKRSSGKFRRSRSRSRSRRSLSRMKRSRTRSRSRRRTSTYSKPRSRSKSPYAKRRKSNSRSPSTSKSKRSRSGSLYRSRSKSQKRNSSSRDRSGSRRSRSRSIQRSSYRARSSSSSSLSSTSSGSAKSKSKSKSRSKSKSPLVAVKSVSKSPEAPAPPIIRYYGRKKSDMSSSESSSDDDYEMKSDHPGTSDSNNRFGNNSGSASKVSKNHQNIPIPKNKPASFLTYQKLLKGRPASTLTVIERLKLKRQAQINRQFKKDKIAEVQKIMREKQAQQTREDELRELAIKLRRRQRELRHAYDRSSSSNSDESDSSKKKESSASPVRTQRSTERDREKDRRDRDRRRSSSRDRNRREIRRNRSRDRDRSSRTRSNSRSRRRYDRNKEDRDEKRGRSPDNRESGRKLVDY